jgi:hypothetical protein
MAYSGRHSNQFKLREYFFIAIFKKIFSSFSKKSYPSFIIVSLIIMPVTHSQLRTLLTHLLFLLFIFSGLAQAQEYAKFNTTGYPKALGVEITVEYPAGWSAEEEEDEGVVQTFTDITLTPMVIAMVQVKKIPSISVNAMKEMSLEEWAKIYTDSFPGAKITEAKQIKHQELTGVVMDALISTGSGASHVIQKQRVMNVFYQDKMISLWCGVANAEKPTVKQIEAGFEQTRPTCERYLSTMRVINKK